MTTQAKITDKIPSELDSQIGAGHAIDVGEITLHLNGENRHRVQAELHILDDDGLVTMRNGFYKPSAAYRRGEHA